MLYYNYKKLLKKYIYKKSIDLEKLFDKEQIKVKYQDVLKNQF